MTSPISSQDASTILAIATLAAMADGRHDQAEQARLTEAATALGLTNAAEIMTQVHDGALTVDTLVARLDSPQARQAAYDAAAAVCHADGWINPSEGTFLRQLATALGANTTATDDAVAIVNRATGESAGTTLPNELDTYILDQAIVTAGLEILPDGLANLGILPLQLRMVQQIGAKHGQPLDINQVKDLAATLGLGAAAQVLEQVVRRTFGGLAGGLLGGLLGGTAGLASGAAVTFAATYALGHAANQYYAQNRQLSTADLKALFARFRGEGDTMFPRVEARVRSAASSGSLSDILRSVTR
jgi:tellurite resistance protein/uncharacterized protein (DUF697 family)